MPDMIRKAKDVVAIGAFVASVIMAVGIGHYRVGVLEASQVQQDVSISKLGENLRAISDAVIRLQDQESADGKALNQIVESQRKMIDMLQTEKTK